MTYRLKHPRISSAFVEVDTAKQRDAHVNAGWVLEDGPRPQTPKKAKKSPARKPTRAAVTPVVDDAEADSE